MCASEISLLRIICGLLPYLFPLALSIVTLALTGISIKSIWQLFQQPHKHFVDGVHSADLALEMTGRNGDIGPIIKEAGHLPLLRNLGLDSRVFIPLYMVSFAIATVLLIGMPFACGAFAFEPLAALALLLTLLSALLDWSENACLVKALRVNAQGGETVIAERQRLLGQGRARAVIKFILLGGVAGLLAIHAWQSDTATSPPDWARHTLGAAFGTAAIGMLACPIRPRYLEPAVAIAGFGIALLFTLHAWKILP